MIFLHKKTPIKKAVLLIVSLSLMLSGCGKGGGGALEVSDIQVETEKLVKEFAGTINIYKRTQDNILLTAEKGEGFENYAVDIKTGQAALKESDIGNEQYVYYEQLQEGGCIYVESGSNSTADQNILKYKDKNGTEKVVAANIGTSDGINLSVSNKGSKFVYTALKEGSEGYGLYLFDSKTGKVSNIMDAISTDFIAGFNYLVNWSPDDAYVIINEKSIFDTATGSKKSEIQSAYTSWSPTGGKIAFILEENSEEWLYSADAQAYPGKRVCVFDMKTGDYQEVFAITNEEYVFGDIVWSRDEKKIAFTGIQIPDKSAQDWYMKLIYNAIYVADVASKHAKRFESHVDASGGELVELGNLKFTDSGNLLSYTVGNYDKSTLYVFDTDTMAAKSFDNVEYLHWIDGEDFVIPAGESGFYFTADNKLIRLDEKMKDTVKYTSKTKLDDFYLSKDGISMILLEAQDNGYVIRYLGK